MENAKHFGVLIAGDELLSGKRTDRHLPHVIATLQARGMRVAWSRVVSDHRKRLVHELKLTRLDAAPVFCFGGIGATPDDQTRQAAAEAFGRPLVRNLEAVAMIKDRFGDAACPNRIRMADLPAGCVLIPNPDCRIPGFSLCGHHFFPGFPSLAWPMLEWVLDHYYPHAMPLEVEKSVRVFDVSESGLIPLMNRLSAGHTGAALFSLPHIAAMNSIELGFRGERAAVEDAFTDLVNALTRRGLRFESLFAGEGETTNAFRQIVV